MITGAVSTLRFPSIAIELIDGEGRSRVIDAHLDTGFSGELTLPKAAIAELGIKMIDRSNYYRIGNNELALFNAYAATIRWHGGLRQVTAMESEIFPVVGVGLLWENNLSVDFIIGGNVAIRELPASGG